MECIFCKIVTGEIPSMKVYEDENTLVFMDIAKDVEGHMVAIPKKHVKNIVDCDVSTLNSLMKTVKKISTHCIEKCNYDGINLLNANGESAGQSVPHFHMHIIPRTEKDNIDAWPQFQGADSEISEIFEKIKMIK